MTNFLKIKKMICKMFTFFIFPSKLRRYIRNILFWFSLSDYIRFKKQKFLIISLGEDCLPRILSTAERIKPRKFYGEKSYPFDLCRMNTEIITQVIKNDFKNFFELNSFNKLNFPHDYKLTYRNFKKRYLKRIKNFNNALKSDKMLYFINSTHHKKEFCGNQKLYLGLYNVIKEKRGNKPFKIIFLNKKFVKNINNPDIIQITNNFWVDKTNWPVLFFNQYKEFNNKYTDFCTDTGNKLKNIIKKHQS